MSTPQHTLIHVKTAPHIGAGEQVQAFASQAWCEFNPWSLCKGEKREPTLRACSLRCTNTLWRTCPPTIINKQTDKQTKQAFTCLKPTKFSPVNGRRQTQLDSQLSCYCKPGHFLHLLPSPFPSSFYLPSLSSALGIKPRDLCMLAKYSYH